ncbi:MAG: LutB/LldF family L-lactate oxidation iron-sulfur protein [Armatimonadota bacterium]|nr:LutB/LldF family L-lactate oxidation iron-sulfur protein [Armatimonadota bacterium]MDR7452699.1 LutB/LldF family L-lactate oxidation iron-sulfur protein [Armatimonadota bacterium]MDR7467304.1 LutB/LldF family L-lactate oxidation iron-sulfur protein [Armatimonadota bacterium]MDR7494565.1 LutB/LldF family L-lactate oxidation iron-sulfur protein [Armatimonadota bacterium]MDR7504468.1 LutB/LldF family L-lactate oxidation iron-sulfur protein [Armatimonadota bacterium]
MKTPRGAAPEPGRPIDFVRNARLALGDPFLRAALRATMVRFRDRQAAVIAEVPEWQALRDYACAVKRHTLGRLDQYLEQLEAQVALRGGHVHWARDGAEAAGIIARLARGRRVVKSKSMTSEEIGLNEALASAGCEVTETDLGEYLLQLAGEAPSHLIAPIVHRSKEFIAALLSAAAGRPLPAEPERLTAVARELLRRRFLEAEVGITGANFLVAETGTVVLVENEGNIRLTTTIPRVHIALAGVEKVIPRLADLAVFLTLLPRAATGQRMSSYVSLLTGPRRSGERDGPEEFHLVLVDNGRTAVHGDETMREVLACIRCGACLDVCPVFERVGGHAYGSVYSGPIGAVLTPLLQGLTVAGDLPFASSLCGACGEVCPVKIDLPRLLLELRARVVRSRGAPLGERLFLRAWTWVMGSAVRLTLAGSLVRLARGLVGPRPRWLPAPLSRWIAFRDLPPAAPAAFRRGRRR